MKRRAERTVLVLILILFAALSAIYSIVVPPFEASDELWHYPMVKYVADHWDLPVQDPTNVGPWRQEGSQPPLYYAVAAAVTFWIDTSDMEQVRHLNPHVDNGIATPDGNINLVVHNPALERFPWRGAVLAVHLIRFLSVLMGVAAVYFTYRIADECLATTEGRPDGVGDRRRGGSPCPPQGGSPLGRASVPAPEGWATTEDRPYVALAAAAVHAFTPMFVFISGAVNNDNLALPLCGLGLWMLLRLAKEQEWTTRQALG
ncbi:MAG TPA: hypothetical protein ENI37_08775, partial [Chloroflexi bacterium]|nr:hypothetical protein [Chloroflexota bacterium]